MEPKTYLSFYIMLVLRYIFIAGIAFLFFYILFSRRFKAIKIQQTFPKNKDYMREIGFSFLTLTIFALFAFALRSPFIRPHTKIYIHISDYGWVYFAGSFVATLFIHDTYFYWMHHPLLFRLFHLTHHRSTNPSPWAAYAFNPLEAVVEGGIIFVITFTIPVHPLTLGLFMLFMITYNVYGHLGYEIYPKWVVKSWLGRWLNTSTNHNLHHKYFRDNYGLYFRFWDEIMKTTSPKYEETLNGLVSGTLLPRMHE